MTDMTTKQKRPSGRKVKEEAKPSEQQKVEDWNREQINKLFSKRGLVMPAKQVDELVKARRTDHDVKALLDKGCTPELAIKILT